MTPLSWIKSKDKASPLILSQINGLTVLCLIGVAAYLALSPSLRQEAPTPPPVAGTDPSGGAVVVEVSGETVRRGIYCLPPETSLDSFLRSIGLSAAASSTTTHALGRFLRTGANVAVGRNGHVEIAEMAASTRLALGLPLDVNTATKDDLILVPGIKDAAAEKILAFRKASGGRINRMEDLLKVDGIKEKRLRQYKMHLSVFP